MYLNLLGTKHGQRGENGCMLLQQDVLLAFDVLACCLQDNAALHAAASYKVQVKNVGTQATFTVSAQDAATQSVLKVSVKDADTQATDVAHQPASMVHHAVASSSAETGSGSQDDMATTSSSAFVKGAQTTCLHALMLCSISSYDRPAQASCICLHPVHTC